MGRKAIRSRFSALIALAILLEAGFVVLARQPPIPLPRTLLWFSAAAIVYLIAVGVVVRAKAPSGGVGLRFILLAAVVFRLTLLPLTPTLSQQAWRYQWEGRIEHAGFNPYVYAPDNGLFNPIRTAADKVVPAPERAATHPPLAEILFHWNYEWFPGLRMEKILFVVLDLALMLLLVRVLKARGLAPEWVLIYAWSPLAVYEIAGNGHVAPVAGLLALAGLYWCRGRARVAGVAIAAAGMTLWYGLLLVPVVVTGAGRKWASALGWGIVAAAVLTLPFAVASKRLVLGDMVRNMRAAAAAPEFNASLYGLSQAWFGAHAGAVVAVGLVALATVLVCLRGRTPAGIDALRAAFVILSTLLLVLPQVHPWMVLWLLPLLVFFPEAPWLYFSVAVMWAYAIGSNPHWVIVEYAPLYALLGWQAWRGRQPRPQSMAVGP